MSLVIISEEFNIILSDGFLSYCIYFRFIVLLGKSASWIVISTFSLFTNRSRILCLSTDVNYSYLNLPCVRSVKLISVSSKSDLELYVLYGLTGLDMLFAI